jgi:hypothetical protein
LLSSSNELVSSACQKQECLSESTSTQMENSLSKLRNTTSELEQVHLDSEFPRSCCNCWRSADSSAAVNCSLYRWRDFPWQTSRFQRESCLSFPVVCSRWVPDRSCCIRQSGCWFKLFHSKQVGSRWYHYKHRFFARVFVSHQRENEQQEKIQDLRVKIHLTFILLCFFKKLVHTDRQRKIKATTSFNPLSKENFGSMRSSFGFHMTFSSS